MALRRRERFRYGFAALAIAVSLWALAHGRDSIERGFDIPVALDQLPEGLVITEQSDAEVNIRLLGSKAALRNVSTSTLAYRVNMAGSKSGSLVHEVDTTKIDLPRGVRIVSRSPSQLTIKLESRARKRVEVKPAFEGELPDGMRLVEARIEPAQVWIAGARSRVLRVAAVTTEAIDLGGVETDLEREVGLVPPSNYVWFEEDQAVTLTLVVAPGRTAGSGRGRR